MPNDESWETTSGLLDDYVMTIQEAWFAKPANYREGKQTVLQIRGEAVDPEDEDEVLDEEKESYYSLGDGWEPDDGGESAAHGSGKTKLNNNSSMGKLINAAVGLGDDVMAELKSRGPALEAATWRGLRFRFNRVEFEFVNRKTGEKGEYAVDLPVEFLGVDEDVTAGRKKAAAKPKTPAKPKAAAKDEDADEAPAEKPVRRRRSKAAEATEEEAPADDLRDLVLQFAADFEDDAHTDFMEAVLDPDEFPRANDVQSNEELLNDVIDEDGSIWLTSRDMEPSA